MAASKLELRDLKFVRQELHSVKEKWLDIGMELGSSPTELRKIAETHKQDYSICLNLMLMQWLESGDASWKILCEALKSSTLDESSLSTQLQEKHCSEKSSTTTSISKSVKRANSDDSTTPKAKRSKATPLPTSFPPEDFLRPQPPNRICYKCNKIPRTPLRPECCSTKLYCEPCSLKVKVCSTHGAENKFKRDDEHFTLVPKLKVKCPNWKVGCDFKETASKVYREHLPHCTKAAKKSLQDTNAQLVSSDPGASGATQKKKSGSKAKDSRMSTSDLEEEDVWYMAYEQPSPRKTVTQTGATAPPTTATLKTLLSPKGATSPSLSTKNKAKLDTPGGGQILPSTSQQQVTKPSANIPQSQVQSPKLGSSASIPVQQAKCPEDRVVTQPVIYDEKQLSSMIEKLPASQMVWCLHKPSGCTWKGVVAQLVQHLSVCQYNKKGIQTKVKTEIKQESQVHTPPATHATVPTHHPVKTQQQTQYIKQEPSSPQIFFGSDKGRQAFHVKKEPSSPKVAVGSDKSQTTQPCEYKAIGCEERVPKGKMKEHLQGSIQHHLDLAIKRILQNEMKK